MKESTVIKSWPIIILQFVGVALKLETFNIAASTIELLNGIVIIIIIINITLNNTNYGFITVNLGLF